MFTVGEICELLNVSGETVRRWIRSGELAAQKNGKSYIITKKDLKDFLSKKHLNDPLILKKIEEKQGMELISTYLEKTGYFEQNYKINKAQTDNYDTKKILQRLHEIEEEIIQNEIKVLKYQKKIISLKKEALNLKIMLYKSTK